MRRVSTNLVSAYPALGITVQPLTHGDKSPDFGSLVESRRLAPDDYLDRMLGQRTGRWRLCS